VGLIEYQIVQSKYMIVIKAGKDVHEKVTICKMDTKATDISFAGFIKAWDFRVCSVKLYTNGSR